MAFSLLKDLTSVTVNPAKAEAVAAKDNASGDKTDSSKAFSGVLSQTATQGKSQKNASIAPDQGNGPAVGKDAASPKDTNSAAAQQDAAPKDVPATSTATASGQVDPNAPPSDAALVADLKKTLSQILVWVKAQQGKSVAGNGDAAPQASPKATPKDGAASQTDSQVDPSLLSVLQQLMALYPPVAPPSQTTEVSPSDGQAKTSAKDAGGTTPDPLVSLMDWLSQLRAQLPVVPPPAPQKTADLPSQGARVSTAPPSIPPTPPVDLQKLIAQMRLLAAADNANTKQFAANANAPLLAPPSAAPAAPKDTVGAPPFSNDKAVAALSDVLKLFTPSANAPSAPSLANPVSPLSVGATVTDQGRTTADSGSDGSGQEAGANNGGGLDPTLLGQGVTNAKGVNPYSFASQLSATRAAQGGMTGLPNAVEQVVLRINSGVKNGDSSMTIQLHPADLGRIDVKLQFLADGKVQGQIVADNQATLDVLKKDSGSLERSLQDAGLQANAGSLQFSLGGQSNRSGGQVWQNSSQGKKNAVTGVAFQETKIVPAAETYYLTPGRVNVKV